MKRIWIGCRVGAAVFAVLACVAVVCAAEQASDPKMQAKRMLALRSGARKVVEAIAGVGRPGSIDAGQAANKISAMMLADVERFSRRAASRDALKSVFVARQRDEFEQTILEILDDAQTLSPLPLDRNDLVERLPKDWTRRRDENIGKLVDQAYPAIFDQARQSAVALQKERIASMVGYPILEFVDASLTRSLNQRGQPARPLGTEAFEKLSADLKEVNIQAGRLFEEVESAAIDLAGKIGREIQGQYEEQISIFEDRTAAIDAKIILEGDIHRVGIAAVESALEPRVGSRSGAPPVYPVFAAVREYARARAKEIQAQRLIEFIGATDLLALESEQIRDLIRSDPQAHSGKSQSKKLIVQHFADQLRPKLAEKYQQSCALEPEQERTKELIAIVQNDDRVRGSYRKTIERAVADGFESARAEIAAEQIATLFPGIDGEWDPTTEAAEWLYDRQKQAVDNYAEALELLEAIPDVGLAPQEEVLLQEAEDLLVEKIDDRVGPAAGALGAQLRIVGEMEGEKMDALRAQVADGISVDGLIEEWMAEWRARWADVPASGEFPYAFRRTRSQIDKTVRQLFDSLSRQIQSERSESEQRDTGEVDPSLDSQSTADVTEIDVVEEQSTADREVREGEVLAEAMSPGMSEMIAGRSGSSDCIFYFSDSDDGGCLFEFGIPGAEVYRSMVFAPDEIESGAERLAQDMAAEIESIAAAKAADYSSGFRIPIFSRREAPELSVYVRVESRRLRHLTMLRLRRHIRSQLEALSAEHDLPSFELDWNEWRSAPAEDH